MSIVVTNTLTGRKEPFVPRDAKRVTLYVCGLTPYDHVHIGHARTYTAWDIIRRYLEHRGFGVMHVQNITDVEDKLIARARELGENPVALAARMHDEAWKDLDALNVVRAHAYPRVSEHIDGIVAMTRTLVEKGFAYVTKDEHGTSVYFEVAKDPDYGKLSKVDRDAMLEGVRKDVAEGKRDAADFALWKSAKPGEISWDSPWGPGRPGWHIECSVMATKLLGPSIDVHGGGMDLKFPHHENELAQSESATGVTPFVKYWMHTGFLTVEGEKMSKSLGNFVTLRAALGEWPPEVLRLWLAGTHYLSPIDYSEAGLAQAGKNVERIANMLANVDHAMRGAKADAAPVDTEWSHEFRALAKQFESAMDDDFNTPKALAVLFEMVTDLNKYASSHAHAGTLTSARAEFLKLADDVFGIVPKAPAAAGGGDAAIAGLLDLLLESRQAARARKDFATSDRIRDRLAELGFVIEDSPTGPKWRKK